MKQHAGLAALAALVFTVACGGADSGITTDVKTSLAADEVVSAYQIDVDTDDGVVTLTGTVDSSAAKMQAVQIAQMTSVVREVVDHLEVDAAATTGFDTDLDDRVEQGARDAAGAVGDAAREVGEAAREGAEAAAEGAKEVGSDIRDAVTGDD